MPSFSIVRLLAGRRLRVPGSCSTGARLGPRFFLTNVWLDGGWSCGWSTGWTKPRASVGRSARRLGRLCSSCSPCRRYFLSLKRERKYTKKENRSVVLSVVVFGKEEPPLGGVPPPLTTTVVYT